MSNYWMRGTKPVHPSTESPRESLLDEIISLTNAFPDLSWSHYLDLALESGGEVADAANSLLSTIITRSPDLALSLCSDFSFCSDRERWLLQSPLHHGNKQTLEIMKQAGADSGYIQYRLMSLSTDIPYWQQCLDEGVNATGLNWLLIRFHRNQAFNRAFGILGLQRRQRQLPFAVAPIWVP
jgi:hypothetical protein